MRVTTSKSKNAESFYITKGYINDKGVSTSVVVRKLGTLKELSERLGTDRDGVMAWAREQAIIETEKYKDEQTQKRVQISFHADRQLDFDKRKVFAGGYLFLQSIYHRLRIDAICRKIRDKHKFDYDLNAILSDLVYARILEPGSKLAAYKTAQSFLESPSYQLHDVYRALSVIASECDLIQAEVYKNSHFLGKRNDRILYYDCTNYYFEIEQEDGERRYGKSKEHRPNPIVQMGLFMDGDGIPLAFSTFPGNQNEQKSLRPLEQKVLNDFACDKFIYCSDAGLASEDIRAFNHSGNRAFIVTQSIKKLKNEYKATVLDRAGFRRVSDNRTFNISKLDEEDMDSLFYKEIPYDGKKVYQRLIVTYSPKYAAYQKAVRAAQVARAEMMIKSGKTKKERRNPNDPARFINKVAVTDDGETAKVHYYLDEDKISEEEQYDGFYAVCTDLLNDPVRDILNVSEGRWQIEECFRIMKTDFEARPVFLSREDRIKAHFLTCFLALTVYRYLEHEIGNGFTCEQVLATLREMNFAEIEEQGFIPLYQRTALTDALHQACGFRTDWQFISKSKMKSNEKMSKDKKLL